MKKLLVVFISLIFAFSMFGGITAYAAEAETNDGAVRRFDTEKTYEQMFSEMKVGWNLGNSLDATDGVGVESEISWGNPKTTEKMILDVKAKGFGTIRIPVSWGKHTDSNGIVDNAWLMRVKEVVNYAYDNDMYVILNTHHDNDYYDIKACLSDEKIRLANTNKMVTLWTQIGNEFKDYDEHLLFETLNEPRIIGSKKEWTGGTKEEREIVYDLNKAIVSAIRQTGGNNQYRYIMLPSYAATERTDILQEMKLPEDERIIVAVHAYTPYGFAMNANGIKTFGYFSKKKLDNLFSDLNDIFVSKGIPVIIGECGAVSKDNLKDRCAWAEYFVREAKRYNILCVVWDNNSPERKGNESFVLYDRQSGEWVYPEFAEAMVKAANEPVGFKPFHALDVILPIIVVLFVAGITVLVVVIIKRKKKKGIVGEAKLATKQGKQK